MFKLRVNERFVGGRKAGAVSRGYGAFRYRASDDLKESVSLIERILKDAGCKIPEEVVVQSKTARNGKQCIEVLLRKAMGIVEKGRIRGALIEGSHGKIANSLFESMVYYIDSEGSKHCIYFVRGW